MKTVACRSCAARIGFIELPSGKKMPVDPVVQKTWMRPSGRKGRIVLVTKDGAVLGGLICDRSEEGAEPVEGFIPHWSTCSDPDAHRATGGKQ